MARRKKSAARRPKKTSVRRPKRKIKAKAKPRQEKITTPPAPSPLTHIDHRGEARMVDVTDKGATERIAIAEGRVIMRKETLDLVLEGNAMKGDVLGAARLAGIMAAKRTGELIPLCHPLPLDAVSIGFSFPDDHTVAIEAEVRVTAKTGVEMESLTAVSIAALTIYDMCKAMDRAIVITQIRLEEKSGGRSGHFAREGTSPPAGSGAGV
jgi:cyclic pyranopterin phosphate synthase